MIFNIIKCHRLHIGKKFTGTKYPTESDGRQVELEKDKNEKDVGVTIDQNLTFRDHIASYQQECRYHLQNLYLY